jgi:branched-chain amino acid transport system substrate-binding protein
LRVRAALALAAVAATAPVLAACGKDDNAPPGPGASQLTVYSSLPLQGPFALQSQSIVNAEKLALSEAGGRVGPFTVKYVSLDDSKASTGRWDPGTVSSNARRAVEDRTTIAYLGEADSGASAVAIPVLNEAGILTVSPASTYPGLTTSVDADKGEPEKYYPSGTRTFARVVPVDSHQAQLQARLLSDAGCRSVYVISDRDVYGRGIAGAVAREADAKGLDIAGETSLLRDQKDFGDVAEQVAKSGAPCVFTGMTPFDGALGLYRAVHAAAPQARFFAPDALATPAFAAGLDEGSAARTTLTSIAPADGPRARAFVRAYTKRYGREPESYAVYGYEAMKAVLDAVADSGNHGNRRPEVARAFFALRERDTALGRWSVSRSGDVSLARYAVQRIAGGKLRTQRIVSG